jgi:hypothetical protein
MIEHDYYVVSLTSETDIAPTSFWNALASWKLFKTSILMLKIVNMHHTVCIYLLILNLTNQPSTKNILNNIIV